MQDLTITLIQAGLIWGDKQANLELFSRRLEEIAEHPDLILLPEMFTTGFIVEPEAYAETMEGPSLQWLKEKSSLTRSVMVGSLIIREQHRYFNRLIWMRPDGTYDFYDKRHLFSYAREHRYFSRGNHPVIIEYKGWRFIPLVCYDLRFPVWSRNRYMAGHYAYDCLIYLANWPDPRRHAWNTLLAGRAIENMAYAVGVNRVGTDGKGLKYAGDSAVYDPFGNAIASCTPYQEAMVTARLSSGDLARIRRQFAFGQDWDQFGISEERLTDI